MASSLPNTSEYKFDLQVMDTSLAASQVRQRLQEALSEALDSARRDGKRVEAKADAAFGGGRATILLVFKAFAGGVADAAERFFYRRYLKPQLERTLLFPSNLKSHHAGGGKP